MSLQRKLSRDPKSIHSHPTPVLILRTYQSSFSKLVAGKNNGYLPNFAIQPEFSAARIVSQRLTKSEDSFDAFCAF